MEEKQLSVKLPADIHSDLKVIAAFEKLTMKEIILECIEKYIQDYEERKKKETEK